MGNLVFAIDPGTTESGWVYCDGFKVLDKGKYENSVMLNWIRQGFLRQLVIEEINPYTMGKTTRDTILWSGRFQEAYEGKTGKRAAYISRIQVRQNLCGSGGSNINDKVVRQALVDRFAYGEKNFGKGTKKNPGYFHGFSDDIWQAYALAVTHQDMKGALK